MQNRVILFLILFVTIAAQAQQLKLTDPKLFSKNKYYLWNAHTGSNLVTDTDIFLYGSYLRTQVPKDSLDDFGDGLVRAGTKTSSKYSSVNVDDGIPFPQNTSFENYTLPDGWSDAQGAYTTDFIDTLGYTSLFTVTSPSTYLLGIYAGSLPIEFIGDSIRIRLGYYVNGNSSNAIRIVIESKDEPNWDYRYIISFYQNNAGYHTLDTTMKVFQERDYVTNEFECYIQDNSTSVKVYFDYLEITAIGGYDSVRTLARTIDATDLLEGHEYTYYTSVLQPNGRYSKGADSTFTTLLPAPTLTFIEEGYSGVRLNWYDNSRDEDGFYIYVNDVKVDSVDADTTSYCYDVSGWIDEDTTMTFKVVAYTNTVSSESEEVEGTAYYGTTTESYVDNSIANLDFEEGNLSEFLTTQEHTNSTLSITNNNPSDGSYSFLTTANSTNSRGWGTLAHSFALGDTLWLKFDYYGNALNGTNFMYYHIGNLTNSSGQEVMRFQVRTNSTAPYQAGAVGRGVNITGSTTMTNQWNTFIFKYILSTNGTSNDGKAQLWVNGNSIGTPVTAGDCDYVIDSLRFGLYNFATGSTASGDSIKIDNIIFATDSLSLYPSLTGGTPIGFTCGDLNTLEYTLDAEGKVMLDADNKAILTKKED